MPGRRYAAFTLVERIAVPVFVGAGDLVIRKESACRRQNISSTSRSQV